MRKLAFCVVLILAIVLSKDLRTEPITVIELDAWYRGYNETYFNNELPSSVLISRRMSDDRFMAITSYNVDGKYYEIEFNPKYDPSPKQSRATLLHEMCHVRQLVSGEVEFEDHGKKWQSCMHDLANHNAFEDLW